LQSLLISAAMKGAHPRITLLGNNSGRNLGDAAIMSSILESLSRQLPDAEFYVPTIAPQWVESHYAGRYRVRGVNVWPWTLSVRLLGLPTLLCFARSDVALICDGIIFGKRLFNPAFNYLITLVFLVPLARLLKCRVACFNCGIGPFPSRISRLLARWTMNGCDLITMRERDSIQLAQDLGVTKPIELTGDSAFINPVSPRERALEICRSHGIEADKPILGVNVTSYFDMWLADHERVEPGTDLISVVADGVSRARQRIGEALQPVVFSTQPMDDAVCGRLAGLLGAPLIRNRDYLSHDIQAVMRECALLVGMRFHALVLASAVRAPIVGLIYAPKVRGFLRLLNSERYGLELAGLSAELLADRLCEAWNSRQELQAVQQRIIADLRDGAERASSLLCSRFFPEKHQPAAVPAGA